MLQLIGYLTITIRKKKNSTGTMSWSVEDLLWTSRYGSRPKVVKFLQKAFMHLIGPCLQQELPTFLGDDSPSKSLTPSALNAVRGFLLDPDDDFRLKDIANRRRWAIEKFPWQIYAWAEEQEAECWDEADWDRADDDLEWGGVRSESRPFMKMEPRRGLLIARIMVLGSRRNEQHSASIEPGFLLEQARRCDSRGFQTPTTLTPKANCPSRMSLRSHFPCFYFLYRPVDR